MKGEKRQHDAVEPDSATHDALRTLVTGLGNIGGIKMDMRMTGAAAHIGSIVTERLAAEPDLVIAVDNL